MSTSAFIPFLDLVTQHIELERELTEVFQRALNTAAFIGGSAVEKFEQDFAAFCKAGYAVGVSSGTHALRYALLAAGVQSGDSVITVPNTFIATTEAISQVGATPEFVDVEEQTYNMNPAKLRSYLEVECDFDPTTGRRVSRRTGRRVTAVVPVHLYGQMADMDQILDIAETFDLIVVEDACQAHGAEYFSRKDQVWKKAGSLGRAAAFSFYPGKNLGACGEAGAVTTNNIDVAQRIRMIRDHGQSRKYYHDIEGDNGRLDAIQAGILGVKLAHLKEWNAARRECAASYAKLLAPLVENISVATEPSWSRGVYHLFVIHHEDREALQAHLTSRNIGTAIHYPIPLHLQKAYESLKYKAGDFPVAETAASRILSLPMFPQLRPEQQQRVVDAIWEYVDAQRPSTVIAMGAMG